MDRDSFSAGLILVLIIVLTSGSAVFYKMNEQMALVEKKHASERRTLDQRLIEIQEAAAGTRRQLENLSSENERLQEQVKIMSECADGVIRALESEKGVPSAKSDRMSAIINKWEPGKEALLSLVDVKDECKQALEIREKAETAPVPRK